MTFTPYNWQTTDLATLRDNDYTGLLAIQPGGGKTALATMAMAELNPEVVLIIAPESTFKTESRNWPATVKEVTGREVKRIGNSKKEFRTNLFEFEIGVPGVYITTPQFFSRKSTDISAWSGDLLILDEAHMLATPGSSGQRRLSGYSPKDGEPIALRFKHRLALSGTPMRQSFKNMWGIMRFLWPERDGVGQVAHANYWMWCQDRMVSETIYTAQKDRFGNTKTVTNFLTEEVPGRLISEMPCVIIHKRREYCCDYHPFGFLDLEAPQEIERIVALTPKQKKAIQELEDHYMTYLDEHPFVVDLTITQKQRIRQLCLGEAVVEPYVGTDSEGNPVDKTRLEFELNTQSPFLDELVKILGELDDKEPVVVFLESQRFAEVLTTRLGLAGFQAREYSGKTKADLDTFGKDYQVLVAVTSAIGTGTDGLGRVCNTEVWLETPVSLTLETQAQARLDRIGSRGQVQRYLIADDLGYATGQISGNVAKRVNINASLRKVG